MLLALDANYGQWPIKIDNWNEDRTVVKSSHGLYRFLSIPFGLKNAPTMFQRVMDIILSTVKWPFVSLHVDDDLEFMGSVEIHLDQLRNVLEIVSRGGVSLKLKQFFFEDRICYQSHKIHPSIFGISTTATDLICIQLPPHGTELESFLGLWRLS